MKRWENHAHSGGSNLSTGFPDSTNKIHELIDMAHEKGLGGISITDHECLTMHIQALNHHKKQKAKGNFNEDFKIALGNEIYLMTEEEWFENKEMGGEHPYFHFILTALDTEGYKQIRQLSTRAWERAKVVRGLMRRPTHYTDLRDVIQPSQGHVIASSACLGSYLDQAILNDDIEKADKIIKWCVSIFGSGNFYLEIQPCHPDNEDQTKVNKMMPQLADKHNVKMIVTTDAHYLNKESAFIHRTLLQSKDGDREVDEFYKTCYLMNNDELRELLLNQFTNKQIDEMYQTSLEIYNRVQEYNLDHTPRIPQLPSLPNFKIKHIFKDYYDKYEWFKYYAYAENKFDQHFFATIEDQLWELVELNPTKDLETYIDRLNAEWKELKIISDEFNQSMASYYTSMRRIIEIIWESDSISLPARGSAMSFLTSYLLEVTQIDPVPLGEYAPFWRHLSHERGTEIPDIDNDAQASKKYDIIENLKKEWGYDKVLNILTISRLSSKTAVEKSCKGLGINDDIADYIKSLVPSERGETWSIKDCLEGNEEKNRKPIHEFIAEVEAHEHLKECIIALEGLEINRGLHAAGIAITNDPYTEYIAGMRSPKGEMCTCYDLHDCEQLSVVKFDLLTVQGADKIRNTMDLLVANGHMEWQGSLKATYWKYLHPDVINYDDKGMWNNIKNIYSIFQFDTDVAVKALNEVEPESIMDLSATNSILRLMGQPGQAPPLVTFRSYKESRDNWVKDCKKFGLTNEEMDVLEKYLKDSHYIAESQEKVMMLAMDEKVVDFTLKESNLLRKGIAKKKAEVREASQKQFYEWGEKTGARKEFLDYIWNFQFAMSFGYSFSQIHSYSYSVVALQQLNLNWFYPSIYWHCACLTVESNAEEGSDKQTSIDYAKTAKAIYKMQGYGINIVPPDINKSSISFTPMEDENKILFGLCGISSINHEIATEIIKHRPYNSFEEFYDKVKPTPSILIKLAKAGVFDSMESDRYKLMEKCVNIISETKTSLGLANIPKCIGYNVDLPPDLEIAYKFKKFVINKQFLYGKHPKFKSKKLYILEETQAKPFFEKHYMADLEEDKDYWYENDKMIVVDKSLEKALDPQIELLKKAINNDTVLNQFNKAVYNTTYKKVVGEKNVDKWAFESTVYYHNDGHELKNIDFDKYNISQFESLPESPIFKTKSFGRKSGGKTYRYYELNKICGTVLGKNNIKHIVHILTPDHTVVSVKFNGNQYAYYKQKISKDIDGVNKTIDAGWFTRGNLITICGYRNGDSFMAKRYKKSLFQHTVNKINKVNGDGSLELQIERFGLNEDEE